jgi:hypothetical protein
MGRGAEEEETGRRVEVDTVFATVCVAVGSSKLRNCCSKPPPRDSHRCFPVTLEQRRFSERRCSKEQLSNAGETPGGWWEACAAWCCVPGPWKIYKNDKSLLCT